MTVSKYEQTMANLPAAVRAAIEAGDAAAFQCALEELPTEQAERILIELRQIGVVVSDVISDQEFQALLAEFDLLIKAIVDVAYGDRSQRDEVLAVLPKLDAAGYHLGDGVTQIWSGERDETRLTGGLDYTSARLIRYILSLLVDPNEQGGGLDVEEIATTIPMDVLMAIEAQDEDAFQQAMDMLPPVERKFVATQLARLQAQADREAEAWLASLPEEVRQAIVEQDMVRLQAALKEMPALETETILAQLEQAGVLGEPSPDVTQRILSEFEPMILATAAVAKGNVQARPEVEAILENLQAQGWNLVEPIHRIWNGERNLVNLAEGLDHQDQRVISEILSRLE